MPKVRQALNQSTSGPSQGIFGGDSNVIKNFEESNKMSTLLKSAMLQTMKLGKAGKKSGTKGAKKAAAGGSKGKGKKNPNKKPKREPTRTLITPRTRRLRKRRTRSLKNHVNQ